MNVQKKTLAVILGVVDTGYGIIRSLAQARIPIIGIEHAVNITKPEVKTRLCSKIYSFQSEERLIQILVNIAKNEHGKPVLFLSSDWFVKFCQKYLDVLKNLYLIDFPCSEVVELLLEKDSFSIYATEQGFLIPQTHIVKSKSDLLQIVDVIKFPCVIKPVWRKAEWVAAKFDKVFYVTGREEIIKIYDRILPIENQLVIQNWIPGSDRDIYFTLVYFDSSSKCLAFFSGRKIRQWPPNEGSTSSAEPIIDPVLANNTIEIFERLRFSGFGSMEYKKSAFDGKYYIMEPTVGRPDHQSFIATANGVNMPLIAYFSLIGEKYIATGNLMEEPRLWVDEQYELGAFFFLLRRKKFKLLLFIILLLILYIYF